jgi:glycosyltransferase involved in cell wall biosynthesis
VICNSAWTARTAGALQPGGTVAVVHPPVAVPVLPPDARARIRDALDAREDDVVVLSASRFEPWKGHLHLVRALGSLVHLDRWTLWIAGRAERPHERRHEAALRDEVARLGLEARVRFLGERRDVPMLLSGADLLCQSNEGPEPFGVVFAEALLSGVPVVSMDLGGAPEIVGESCGKLVPAGNQEALAGALRELLTDRALRQRLGANGPTHAAARCGPEVVLPQLARALERLGATAAA